MSWSEAMDAMQKGRFVRRVSWEENAVFLLQLNDEESSAKLYCTSNAYQYFERRFDGELKFTKGFKSEDWEVFPYKFNFDNNQWYWVGYSI